MSPLSRLRPKVVNAIYTTYGRGLPFLRQIDKLNRMPLLKRFTHENADAPAFPTREAMWDHLAEHSGEPIDYLEFGVHQGHSILHWASRARSPENRFFGFDTFSGLPEEWNRDYPAGRFDAGGKTPTTADTRVTFVKGLFQDTLPGFLETFRPRARVVVNVDCDLYSSTLYCLTMLDRVLKPGSLLIFDEFGDVQHEFRAFNDYCASYRRKVRTLCTHDDYFTAAFEVTQ